MSHNKNELLTLEAISQLKQRYCKCGITTEVFEIKKEFGLGGFTNYKFDGLCVRQLNLEFYRNLQFKDQKTLNSLLFSVLIQGEKKINIPDRSIEIVQENLEGYISYIDIVNGDITYPKGKKIKEIVFKMSGKFIEKHQLNTLLPLYKAYAIENIEKNLMLLIDNQVQNILNELLIDKRNGILKRLFLEAKVLELLTFQIDNNQQKQKKNKSIIKKVYRIENIIESNLETQFTVHELSKKVYLNEAMLKKEFKRIFGESIFKYSLKIRMNEAIRLLYQTTKPVYEISELVGYKNATHFTAAFKKHTQLTPKEFRKKELLAQENSCARP